MALAGVGVAELAQARRGRSLLDDLGEVAIDHAPLPMIELGVQLLGTADKPLLRLQSLAALVGGGAVTVGGLGWGRRVGPRLSCAAAAVGVVSLVAADRALVRRQPAALDALARVSAPGQGPRDGAEHWAGATPFQTPPEVFYVTDVTMRPPVLDAADWRLEVVDAQGGRVEVDASRLAALELRERDAVLACIHNRPGWDRLGQQRWTGLPLVTLWASLGLQVPSEDDAPLDLVMQGADGLVMVLPWSTVVSGRSWLVTGMGGRPLSAAHGHPARVMTPSLPGQYGGVKWVTSLRLVPQGEVRASWEARGWPRGPLVVPLMARIDSPGRPGMPPRRPGRVRVPGRFTVTGVAWAPGNEGVAGVDVRVDDGQWRSAELAEDQGADCWRRWRLDVELEPGSHDLAVRCRAHDGSVQAGTGRPPFPHGADGFHRVKVAVRAG